MSINHRVVARNSLFCIQQKKKNLTDLKAALCVQRRPNREIN